MRVRGRWSGTWRLKAVKGTVFHVKHFSGTKSSGFSGTRSRFLELRIDLGEVKQREFKLVRTEQCPVRTL